MPRARFFFGIPREYAFSNFHNNRTAAVLINLIGNGVDALRNGGTITIATQIDSNSKDGGEVTCTITDNGTGIPEENLQRIFNPFFTTKRNTGGIGLGLSISLSVMKKHNGLITVRSKLGEGSTFKISLPSSRS
ncbi:HAMP domain-containing histidine kinase [bacterium]|nr:MAG: HAMP domain-containing histidine kinase [bacterium]